jgi:hypothetical protein
VRGIRTALAGLLLVLAVAVPAAAKPPRVTVINLADHTSAEWRAQVAQAAADWSASPYIDISVGSNGKLAVYNGAYGSNYPWSWTVLTQRTSTISLNDTYLAGATPDQRQHAICAEIGNAISSNEGCRDRVTGEWFTTPTAQDFADLAVIYGP